MLMSTVPYLDPDLTWTPWLELKKSQMAALVISWDLLIK